MADSGATPPANACAGKLPDFSNSTPPADYGGTTPASETDLAVFAWQHFVALNWASSYPDNQKRGLPASGTFFGKSGTAQPSLTVWQSYRHKNELFPASGSPNSNFDVAPNYVYSNITGACTTADTNPNEFINLDENSQLGLCYMFAKPSGADADIQVLFQAKVNRANYDYIVNNALYTSQNQGAYTKVNKSDLAKYGAICQQSSANYCAQTLSQPPSQSNTAGYCLPCGGTGSEGTIHVKAAWRALTATEVASGRYFTAPVVIYQQSTTDSSKVCYSNDKDKTWGLIGLHIIHKTETFPAFLFATWEHVDNPSSHLSFENTEYGGPSATVGKKTPWSRVAHNGSSLPATSVQQVNQCVQQTIAKANPSSVWQNYQLVGIQGTPVDYQNRSGDLPDYFLANNVIESNAFFQSFVGNKAEYSSTGDGPAGTTLGTNVSYKAASYDVGGCQGCHGNAQQAGLDMSFLGAGGASKAEAIGEFENISPRVALFRSLVSASKK